MIRPHDFCKSMEKKAREGTGKNFRDFWTHKNKISHAMDPIFEVHGPDGFYWSGRACCPWAARARAYEELKKS